MPKFTLALTARLPYGGIRSSGGLVPTGGTDIEVLADASDATYGRVDTYTVPADYRTAAAQAGAGERIVSVCPYVRSKQPGTKTVSATVGLLALTPEPGAIYEGVALRLTTNAAIANYELEARQGQFLRPGLGDEWTVETDKAPMLSFRDPHTSADNRAYWYEAGLYCYTLKPATVANPTAPTGTVTTTQYPTCTATVSSIVESWQKPSGLPSFFCGIDVEWSVYSGSLTVPAGTPLVTWQTQETVDTYIDGTTPTAKATSATPPLPLPNGALTLFARVSRDHPAGTTAWSAYSYKQFTMDIPNPTTPTLSLSADSDNQRISATVNAAATTGYDSATCEVTVQRQVAAGVWREVRGMTAKPHTVDSAILVGYDYEGARAIANTYRARVSMWHTVDAVRRYSAWHTPAAVTGPALTGWNLKALEDPELNWIGAPVLAEPSEASQRQSATFAPLHRARPVVTSGIVAGLSGSLEILAKGVDAVAALEALENYSGLMLSESAFGDAKYIRPTAWAWARAGTATNPVRRASVEYTEVGADLEVEG